ncbi:MAG: beta-lactamase family protein [Bacteroidales bacterium]|nr:beta-lactamase family protein [Bacteroidales bacterium]
MKKLLLITSLFLISFINLSQEDFDKTKLDNYFDVLERNNKFMGSVAISKDGEIIYTKSVGFFDFKNNRRANENSKYRIGSISKTFTTVLVLKAVEENKISLDQTIDQFFPIIENADKITIKHLLGHRSGIHNFTSDSTYFNWNTQAKTPKEMVKIIAKKESDFEPGEKAQYSNSNFVLLTYILQEIFEKTYSELLSQYITTPIGLTNTYLGGKINTNNNECYSYKFMERWELEPETDMSIPLGAGGVVSTPSDLVKFSNALFGGKLLKKESLDLMKTIENNYGIGLFRIPFHLKKGYGHSGGIDGFNSIFINFSSKNISYALVANGLNFNFNDISIAVLSAVYDKSYDIPEFKSAKVNIKDLDQYVGIYSSSEIPLKITITKQEKKLIAQATGQPAFPLEATGVDTFRYINIKAVFLFNPQKNTMVLEQGGAEFLFSKE